MRVKCICGFEFKDNKERATAHLFVCKEGFKEALKLYKINNPIKQSQVVAEK